MEHVSCTRARDAQCWKNGVAATGEWPKVHAAACGLRLVGRCPWQRLAFKAAAKQTSWAWTGGLQHPRSAHSDDPPAACSIDCRRMPRLSYKQCLPGRDLKRSRTRRCGRRTARQEEENQIKSIKAAASGNSGAGSAESAAVQHVLSVQIRSEKTMVLDRT